MDERVAYESYEGFLQASIREYWHGGGFKDRVRFLALLLATREAWVVAWGNTANVESGKKFLTGALGAVGIGVLIRIVVGGPLGILLTGVSVASLVAVYVRNHRVVWARVKRYREIVGEFRPLYEDIAEQHKSDSIGDDQRDLMVDGLMGRFLSQLDEEIEFADEEEEEDLEPGDISPGSFAQHADKKREAEEDAAAADAD